MASPMEASSLEMERIKKELFNMAMRGEWDKVVSMYEKDHRAHHAKITRSGDTALHVAVSDCQEEVVRVLVKQIISKHPRDPRSVLDIQNDRGNTALHFAASMGNVHMCKPIAEVEPLLIGSRNKDGETPLFLAALRGKKDAFLWLHYTCDRPDLAASYCRRKDGQTALHCAIEEEYFDLAFQIIHLYGDLFVNSFDENGLSPLHILASKPFAFKSGVNLLPWHKIIYNCTFVDQLEPPDQLLQSNNLEGENKPTYPENYKDCVKVFQLLRNIVVGLCLSARNGSKGDDVENSERPWTTFNQKGKPLSRGSQGRQLVPYNYTYCFSFVKILCKALLIILGYGSRMIKRIREIKEKHIWSVQIMNELLIYLSMFEDEKSGANPHTAPTDKDDSETKPYEIVDGREVIFPSYTIEWPIPHAIQKTGQHANYKGKNGRGERSAILIAASNGIVEIVGAILELYPVAVHDLDSEGKNIVLLAVEKRNPELYMFLLNYLKRRSKFAFHMVDNNGNSALHLAAILPPSNSKPWPVPSAASQMQWELNWFQLIKISLPPIFYVRYNKEGKTADDIFMEKHNDLLEAGGKWLTEKSTACSVVAGLFVTIAFAASSTVPGGIREDTGTPNLEKQPAFRVFAISSLVALYSSVTAVVMFLAILTSGYQVRDFHKSLPRKLLMGLTSFYLSIASTLISFCSGHFFILKNELKMAAFPVYVVTCLLVIFFAVAQFPLYFQLVWATFKQVPRRSYNINPDNLFFS